VFVAARLFSTVRVLFVTPLCWWMQEPMQEPLTDDTLCACFFFYLQEDPAAWATPAARQAMAHPMGVQAPMVAHPHPPTAPLTALPTLPMAPHTPHLAGTAAMVRHMAHLPPPTAVAQARTVPQAMARAAMEAQQQAGMARAMGQQALAAMVVRRLQGVLVVATVAQRRQRLQRPAHLHGSLCRTIRGVHTTTIPKQVPVSGRSQRKWHKPAVSVDAVCGSCSEQAARQDTRVDWVQLVGQWMIWQVSMGVWGASRAVCVASVDCWFEYSSLGQYKVGWRTAGSWCALVEGWLAQADCCGD
jgi:hypothetical protein